MFNEKLVETANKLVANCREGREFQGLDELYAQNAVSLEAAAMEEGAPREFNGVEAIKQKHEMWNAMTEVHSINVDGPFLHGDDRFSVIFELDCTDKNSQQRMQMREVAVYTVDNGKIAREEFYFSPPAA